MYKKIFKICIILYSLPFLSSCASSTAQRVTLKRAAFDLNCPSSELKISELSPKAWGVEGCQKRATYIIEGVCQTEHDCHSILNSK